MIPTCSSLTGFSGLLVLGGAGVGKEDVLEELHLLAQDTDLVLQHLVVLLQGLDLPLSLLRFSFGLLPGLFYCLVISLSLLQVLWIIFVDLFRSFRHDYILLILCSENVFICYLL